MEDEGSRTKAVALERVDVDPQCVLPLAREARGSDAGAAVPLGDFTGFPNRRGRGLGQRTLDRLLNCLREALSHVGQRKTNAHGSLVGPFAAELARPGPY